MPDVLPLLASALTYRFSIERELGYAGMALVCLAAALDQPVATGTDQPPAPRRKGRRRLMLTIGLAVTVTAGWCFTHRDSVLDPNRIVVFPLRDLDAKGAGEGVATYIGYLLDGSQPLVWVDARELGTERTLSSLGPRMLGSLVRRKGARYYLDGVIVRRYDSVAVVLRLNDVHRDQPLKLAGRAGVIGASEPRLGALAAGDLLPTLLQPGRPVDAGGLRDREPAAITNLLQGERDYRELRFAEALEHYQHALEADSSLVIAAVKGAEAADWMGRPDEYASLAAYAVRRAELLSPKYALLAQGLDDYFGGRTDSAVARLHRLLQRDSSWAEAWTALGEVHYHRLPSGAPAESLAADAFLRASQADPRFTPPLQRLREIAVRRGDRAGAERWAGRLAGLGVDTTLLPTH